MATKNHLVGSKLREFTAGPLISPPPSSVQTLSREGSSALSDVSTDNEDFDEDDRDATRHNSSAAAMSSSQSKNISSPTDPIEKPLTRRQRKALGLPKPRPKRVILTVNGKRPNGSTSHTSSSISEDASTGPRWEQNGSGRLDVRGFRELKI
jgi:OTU domain-containing protein 3